MLFFTRRTRLLIVFFTGLAENKEDKEEESHNHYANSDERVGEALGGEAHEKQHRESESESRDGLEHKVVGCRGLEARVNLTEQNHTVGGSTGEHAEHGEKCLVFVIRIEAFAAAEHIEEGDYSANGAYQDERQPE